LEGCGKLIKLETWATDVSAIGSFEKSLADVLESQASLIHATDPDSNFAVGQRNSQPQKKGHLRGPKGLNWKRRPQ
jgi:hypothetical protein